MNWDKYKKDALRTMSKERHPLHPQIEHGVDGIVTEAGELLDALKCVKFYGKPIDFVNLKEEVGDLMWYIAILCDACNFDLQEVCDINIAKLKARFPDKFTSKDALNRDTDAERVVLESTCPYDNDDVLTQAIIDHNK